MRLTAGKLPCAQQLISYLSPTHGDICPSIAGIGERALIARDGLTFFDEAKLLICP